jgi:hypothetical protein
MLGATMVCDLAAQAAPAGDGAPPAVEAFVREHCFACHGGDVVKGGLDLSVAPGDAVASLWRWRLLRDRVRAGEMPPADEPRPPAAERDAFVAWVDARIVAEAPRLPPGPDRVTIRRLTRTHWENSVHDLFGVAVPTNDFPADDLGYGFDSIGDALTFSTLHLERYLAAAHTVAARVFHGEDPARPERRRFRAAAMRVVDGRASESGDGVGMSTNATVEQWVTLPRDGVYRLRVVAGASQAGDEPAKMALRREGRDLDVIEVPERRVREYLLTTPLPAGPQRFAVAFVNDYYEPNHPDPARRDRNLYVDALEVEGPIDVLPVPPEQRWLHEAFDGAFRGRDEKAGLAAQVAALLDRAWRRPATAEERRRAVRAAEQRLAGGTPLLEVQRYALAAALTSPHFLFRVEAEKRLTGDELAVRLSYFLWGSVPDEGLRALGRSGRLLDAATLAREVERLLADPRGEHLATDFAAQWFELRALQERMPDPRRFQGFDDRLRRAMRRETELLFAAVMREGLDVQTLLLADFTHVDAALARHYGLPHEGDPMVFQRVVLPPELASRGGILGHASVHAVTSNPTRTSPVKRGKWILENLLGQAPPPPPPGNDSFADEATIDSTADLRQQMAQHREKSSCAVCHVRMDALGLALEHYDAIGRFRASDAGGAIDASGELPDGRRLDGLADLRAVIAADPAFVHTFAQKLFVYAVGREAAPADVLRLEASVVELTRDGRVTVADLVQAIVATAAFRGGA